MRYLKQFVLVNRVLILLEVIQQIRIAQLENEEYLIIYKILYYSLLVVHDPVKLKNIRMTQITLDLYLLLKIRTDLVPLNKILRNDLYSDQLPSYNVPEIFKK